MPAGALLPAEDSGGGRATNGAVPPLATLLAMDLRLPPAGDTRKRHLQLLNRLSEGTDVFVQTDREFQHVVEHELSHVVAVEYADDGIVPPMSDPERRQWWRLQQVWALLRQHERESGRRYEFVFKLRTDMDIRGATRLADLYIQSIRPLPSSPAHSKGGRAFLLADRVFGAEPPVMERIAGLFADPLYDGLRGLCGGCGALGSALKSADSGARVFELALGLGDVPSLGCEGTPGELSLALERDALDELSAHLARQYGRPKHSQLPPSDLAAYARAAAKRRAEGGGASKGSFYSACIFSNTFRPGHNFSSEVSFVLHLVRGGVRVERFRGVDAGLFGEGFGLAAWRHAGKKEDANY